MFRVEAGSFLQKSWEKIRKPIRIFQEPDTRKLVQDAYMASFRRAYAEGFTVLEGGKPETTQVHLRLEDKRFTAVWHINYNADGHGGRITELVVYDSDPSSTPRRRLRIAQYEIWGKKVQPEAEIEYGEYDPIHGERKFRISQAHVFMAEIAKSKVDRSMTHWGMEREKNEAAVRSRETGREIKADWARNLHAFGLIMLRAREEFAML